MVEIKLSDELRAEKRPGSNIIKILTASTSFDTEYGSLTFEELEKLYAWHKETFNEGHPFAIRLQDVWYPGPGVKSTKDKGEAQRFESREEADNVLCHLNETWRSDAVIERMLP